MLPCGDGAGVAALPCQDHGPGYPAHVPPAQGNPRDEERTPVVWFVNQYAGSPHHGMEFRHYELGRQLVELGARVVVISVPIPISLPISQRFGRRTSWRRSTV